MRNDEDEIIFATQSGREKRAKLRKLKSVPEVLEHFRQTASPAVQDQIRQFSMLTRMQRLELLAYLLSSANQRIYEQDRKIAQLELRVRQFMRDRDNEDPGVRGTGLQ